MAKAQPLENGVTWADSKSGKLSIAVGPDRELLRGNVIRVWALYKGSHELAPVSRDFTGPDRDVKAREYANGLWRTQ
jgi:hypothetical protein